VEIPFFVFKFCDYSLITYLHIFVYELAASAHVSIPIHAIEQTQNLVYHIILYFTLIGGKIQIIQIGLQLRHLTFVLYIIQSNGSVLLSIIVSKVKI
jgi:hypothetical protein